VKKNIKQNKMDNNGERQQIFDIQQHLERRRREKPELYQGALQDLSLRQKKRHCQRRGFPTTTRHRRAVGGLNLR
jgi:hypothetical protein